MTSNSSNVDCIEKNSYLTQLHKKQIINTVFTR